MQSLCNSNNNHAQPCFTIFPHPSTLSALVLKASSLQSLQLFSLPLMCVLLCTVLQEHCSAQLDQLKAARFAHKRPLLSWVQGQWGEKSRCRTRSQRIAKYMDKNVICFIHADFVPIIHYVFKLLALC